MTIAEQLKKKRNELGLSQEEASVKAGIARRTLAYYESGERVPNAENLLLLCKLYNLDINKLVTLGLENEQEKKVEDKPVDPMEKIDAYLKCEEAKKKAFSRGMLKFAIILTVVVFLVLGATVGLRYYMMTINNYNFGEATAEMWTTLFDALKDFVNNDQIKALPIFSIAIAGIVVLCWIIYFISRLFKGKK